MVIAYIEIEKDETFKGKGNINLIPKGEYWAILYAHKPFRTIFKTNTSEQNIERVKNSHPDVKIYYTPEEMQIRGLELKPGTLQFDEVDEFCKKIKEKTGLDLSKVKESKTKKTWKKYLKENTDSIGLNHIKCKNCGELNTADRSHCIKCDSSLKAFGLPHKHVFDISRWNKKC